MKTMAEQMLDNRAIMSFDKLREVWEPYTLFIDSELNLGTLNDMLEDEPDYAIGAVLIMEDYSGFFLLTPPTENETRIIIFTLEDLAQRNQGRFVLQEVLALTSDKFLEFIEAHVGSMYARAKAEAIKNLLH